MDGSPYSIRMFAGPALALRAYAEIVPGLLGFALTRDANLLVLPLTGDLHEILQAAYGTGEEWLEHGPRLSLGDLAFAKRASAGSELAYIEMNQEGAGFSQAAALWADAETVIKPAHLDAETATRRPRAFWPVNAALKRLGV